MFIICIKPSDATSALLQDRNREFVMCSILKFITAVV